MGFLILILTPGFLSQKAIRDQYNLNRQVYLTFSYKIAQKSWWLQISIEAQKLSGCIDSRWQPLLENTTLPRSVTVINGSEAPCPRPVLLHTGPHPYFTFCCLSDNSPLSDIALKGSDLYVCSRQNCSPVGFLPLLVPLGIIKAYS